jgi:hypothetical protein
MEIVVQVTYQRQPHFSSQAGNKERGGKAMILSDVVRSQVVSGSSLCSSSSEGKRKIIKSAHAGWSQRSAAVELLCAWRSPF